MSTWQLSDGVQVFSFHATYALRDGAQRKIHEQDAQGGTARHVFGAATTRRLPITMVESADFTLINSWYASNTVLALTAPDTSVSTVVISNRALPLDAFSRADHDRRDGVLELMELP